MGMLRRVRARSQFFTWALLVAGGVLQLRAQQPPPSCSSDPAFALLDFWIGTWDVFVRGTRVGENRIEKVLDGCAVTEDWVDARGSRGRSLFYYDPAEKVWKQVWVTDRALGRGGMKEKRLQPAAPGGAVLFLGRIPLASGGSYLDRTTLTPQASGEVRQLIEISTDEGRTWQPTFDAQYIRRRAGG